MTEQDFKGMMAAVILQAVKDYEYLCKVLASGRYLRADNGHTDVISETGKRIRVYFCFSEIEEFLEDYCDFVAEMHTDDILKRLREKRYRARKKAERKGLRAYNYR